MLRWSHWIIWWLGELLKSQHFLLIIPSSLSSSLSPTTLSRPPHITILSHGAHTHFTCVCMPVARMSCEYAYGFTFYRVNILMEIDKIISLAHQSPHSLLSSLIFLPTQSDFLGFPGAPRCQSFFPWVSRDIKDFEITLSGNVCKHIQSASKIPQRSVGSQYMLSEEATDLNRKWRMYLFI